jgi:regulator of sigma E protease
MQFFSTLGNILLFLLVLSLVICIHELGHFLFARRAGILCHEFSFGMGPRIWSKKFGETTFSIRALPFGGFVSMAGEELEAEVVKVGDKIRLGFDENHLVNRIVLNAGNPKYLDFLEVTVENLDLKGVSERGLNINEYAVKPNAFYVYDKMTIQIAPHNRNFNYKSKRQRFMATFGGPMMNIILAFVVFLIIALSFGVAKTDSTKVGAVSDGLPADGVVQVGDTIVAINGVEITAWATNDSSKHTVTTELAKFAEYDTVILTVNRNGTEIVLSPMVPQYVLFGLGMASTADSDDLVVGTPLYNLYDIEDKESDDLTLEAGDRIVSLNGTAVSTWDELIAFVEAHPEGGEVSLVVERDGMDLTIPYTTYSDQVLDAMGYDPYNVRIGITCTYGFDFFGSFRTALVSLGNASISIYKTLWVLLTSSQINLSDLSGVVGIYEITANAASQGLQTLLGWVGLLSVNLGLVNLLPIPALDGGRIAFIVYEAIAKKKPNQKFESILNTVMFFLLMGLMVFITFHDITRLFS